MNIAAIKLENKIEIFAEIFADNSDDPDLTACRITFKKIEKPFKQDKLGDGLLTLTVEQAKSLNTDLTKILEN